MNPPTDAQVGAAVLTLNDVLADETLLAAATATADLLVPVGHRDQTDAAATDTRDQLDMLAQVAGSAVTSAHPANLPEWLRLPLLDTIVRWHTGRARTCMHNPHPSRPQPIYAAAWSPGLVVCNQCPHLVDPRPRSVKDRTCDRCGHITTGPEHGDGIHPCAVAYGPLLYAWGTCTGCHTEPDTAATR